MIVSRSCESNKVMLKLIKQDSTPPGGYQDIEPETRQPFVADNLSALVEKERSYLLLNKRPIPDNLAEIIEDRICRRMPVGVCASPDGERFVGGKSRKSNASVLNATRTAGAMGSRCSQAEAERRAAICVGCANNIEKGGCKSCRGTTTALREMQNGRTTMQDSRIHVCDALGVYTKVLVHALHPVISNTLKAETATQCWVR